MTISHKKDCTTPNLFIKELLMFGNAYILILIDKYCLIN